MERIKATQSRDLLFAIAYGFNGGDGAEKYQENLAKAINYGFEEEEENYLGVQGILDAIPMV